jgi:hypothetical protein
MNLPEFWLHVITVPVVHELLALGLQKPIPTLLALLDVERLTFRFQNILQF